MPTLFSYEGDGWNPEVSPDCAYVGFGGGGIRPSEPGGIPPMVRVVRIADSHTFGPFEGANLKWLDAHTATFLRSTGPITAIRYILRIVGDAHFLEVRPEDKPDRMAANAFETGNGNFASYMSLYRRIIVNGIKEYNGVAGLAMAGNRMLTVNMATDLHPDEFIVMHPLTGGVERRLIKPIAANIFYISEGGLITYGYDGPSWAIDTAGGIHNIVVTPWGKESPARIVHLPNGEIWVWTMSWKEHTQQRLAIGRPWHESHIGGKCVILPGMGTQYLSVGFDSQADAFIVAACSNTGACRVESVSRTIALIPIGGESSPEEDTSGKPFNTFSLWLGDGTNYRDKWPRHDGSGNQRMDFHYDGRNAIWEKFGEPGHFERYVFDGDKMWHREDHSADGQGTGSYSWSPGLWLIRLMAVGDTVDMSNNEIFRFNLSDCSIHSRGQFPYRMGPIRRYTKFDCGGDIGIQEVGVFKYDPGREDDTYELYYCAGNGWGWFRWEWYDQKTNTLKQPAGVWNVRGGSRIVSEPGCRYWILPPSSAPVAAAVTITKFPPEVRGTLQARCECTAQGVFGLWWEYREIGSSAWIRSNTHLNDPNDGDHTYVFPYRSTFEIRLIGVANDGRILDHTVTKRTIEVKA